MFRLHRYIWMLLVAVPAWAQGDFIPYLTIQVESMRYERMLRSNLGLDGPSPAPRPRQPARPSDRPAGPAREAASFRYQPTVALRREALATYVERIARTNSPAAKAVGDELASHDTGRIFADIVRPFGYRDDDAADALAAYTLLAWLIATGAPDPAPQQAAGVRAQIGERVASSPGFATPADRARLGEELKLLFVTLHAGWQAARREGTLPQYSEGVDRMFQDQGTNLRALRLTNQGFAGR